MAAAGFTDRMDFYWTLHACFVNRPEHRVVFAQVFRLYWRDPRYLEHMMSMMLPAVRGVQEEKVAQSAEKRAAQALLGQKPGRHHQDHSICCWESASVGGGRAKSYPTL